MWKRGPLAIIMLPAITHFLPLTSPQGNNSSSYLLHHLYLKGNLLLPTDITLVTASQAANLGFPKRTKQCQRIRWNVV